MTKKESLHVIKHDRDWCPCWASWQQPCCWGLCGKWKVSLQNLSSMSTMTVLTVPRLFFTYYFWLTWFFSQVHGVMDLCFEKNVEKQCGASYIRRRLEEAWSTEGMWDTYLWIRLTGIISFGLLKTIPPGMLVCSFCHAEFYSLYLHLEHRWVTKSKEFLAYTSRHHFLKSKLKSHQSCYSH